jgi:nucleotide-binding universal stress UspA family protein
MAVDPSQSGHWIAYARGNVVIAWKAALETTRAVFDALSLLKGVENVHILEVKGRADETTLGADTSIRRILSQARRQADHTHVGDEILSRLSELDADLLVMGAYGHSRMRELVFGGVTRHMTVPTLFSH